MIGGMHWNVPQTSETEHMEKRDHKPQVHGEQVIKVQCKVDISPQVPFLPCVSSILISYLALLGNLLHEECMVTMVFLRPLAKPANDCHPPHRRAGLSLHGTDRFLSCSSRFTLAFLSHSTMLARCQWGCRFPGSYLILNTGHLLSPSRPIMDSLLFAMLQAWQKLWPQSWLRVLSEAPGKWGRSTSPVGSLIFLKPWQLVPSSYLSWILSILLFTDICIIGKDKRGRLRKVEYMIIIAYKCYTGQEIWRT